MSYCINPKCSDRCNPDRSERCQACDTPLLIQGRYRLIRPLRDLDEWGNTEIFEVDDQGVSKVLKILKTPRLLPLFEREVKTLQQLQHPGIPQVEPDGYFTLSLENGLEVYCLVMEKITGENLEDWMEKRGPIDQPLALKWLSQLAEILDQVHRNELFHRDIKLSNIMLRPNDHLALIDFGTVRKVTNTYLAKIGGRRDVTSVVSPGYTPLEQINGKAVPQSDFYALGRSFVYLLTGKHPVDFEEDSQTGQLNWRDHAPTISPWFANLIDDLMAPFPGQRPLNAQEILRRLATGPTWPQPRIMSKITYVHLLAAINIGLLIAQLVVIGWKWSSYRQYRFNQGSDARIEIVGDRT
ncbi:MAG: serine/threonine-protein kinase [Leptolyngbyaceae cyanobacterium MO_188.B28]|nr:serine/threonine-protein kinase [Leptolyngbyaceae cyanobacterium MO_188.B28]